MEGAAPPSLYEQLFERAIEICGLFPSLTPLSIRELDAEEVITLICRFITLSKRRKVEESGGVIQTRSPNKIVTTANGQRYIIHKYEDKSGLTFGG